MILLPLAIFIYFIASSDFSRPTYSQETKVEIEVPTLVSNPIRLAKS